MLFSSFVLTTRCSIARKPNAVPNKSVKAEINTKVPAETLPDQLPTCYDSVTWPNSEGTPAEI
jgi:hypothetical protein